MSIDNVTDITPLRQYTASAAQTVFPYPFPIFADADLVVDVDGTVMALSTDYTVSGAGDDTGGNVTFLVAMSGGEVVTIYRDTAIERTSDYQQNGPLSSRTINDDFDRLVIICQELKAKIGRAIRFPFTGPSTAAQNEMSPLSTFAGKFLRITAAGLLEAAELISNVVALSADVIGQLVYPQLSGEGTPVSFAYPSGDVRRFVPTATDQPGWYCYGDAATYISATSFSIPGDVTARYQPLMRVRALTNSGVTADMRLVSSTFSAGVTTIVLTDDNSQTLASPILAVSVQATLSATSPNAVLYSNNQGSGAGFMVVQKNTGATASGRMQVFSINDATPALGSGVVLVAIPATFVGPYLTGGATTGKRAALYTGVATELEIGTGDTARLTFTEDGASATTLKTDFTITNGDGSANRTELKLVSVVDNLVSLVSGGITRAAWFASATEVQLGASTNIDLSLTQNGARVLTFRGGNTTGASTPTLSANKPGSNAGVIEWVAVKTSAGTTGWMPIFGN